LLNRREFERVLNEEEERARRFQHPLGLVMVDIDHFKSVNDTHGHAVGDEVLREVARRVAGEVRSVDRAMRYGGEELALVLVQSDSAAAADVARRVCAAVRREPVRVSGGRALRVTVSAGFAAFPHDAESGPQLLNAADKALYAAKAQGRDRAVAFGEVKAGR
jgi:diguanylate cyclase (GGDEF)-like protein